MKAIPLRQRGREAFLDLLDEHDTPWIAALLDEVEAAVGRPWRELHDRIARLPTRSHPSRRGAVIQALRPLLGGRERAAIKPRDVRERLLGRSALDSASREARLIAVASALTTTVDEIERAIYADSPAERDVVMRDGRPSETSVAAAANLMIVQRALLRCHEMRLHVFGNARTIANTAAVRGLLTIAKSHGPNVVLEISGPLALFHRTSVYGRALGSLVPHLAWCERFILDAQCDFGRGPVSLRIQPPLLLPPSRAPKRYDSAIEARFARDMSKAAPHWRIVREPSAIDVDGHVAFPDFLLEHRAVADRTWWLEIVGFWTPDYIAQKLATYRAAKLPRVIMCIDAKRTVDSSSLPIEAQVVRYSKRIPVEQVLAIIDRRDHDGSEGHAA